LAAVQANHLKEVGTAENLAKLAVRAALDAFADAGVQHHLAEDVAYKVLCNDVMAALPDKTQTATSTTNLELKSTYDDERARLKALIDSDDYDEIVRSYPIRTSPLPTRIANALHYRSASDYQAALRGVLEADTALCDALRSLAGSLKTP
jgi:hypothetical protein